jgi:hypothetical protein
MPTNTRPKHTAVVHFSCAGHRFAPGDPVDHPIVLDAVLPFGDQFVTTDSPRAAKAKASSTEADPPASATTSPTEATP